MNTKKTKSKVKTNKNVVVIEESDSDDPNVLINLKKKAAALKKKIEEKSDTRSKAGIKTLQITRKGTAIFKFFN
jgi:hypothetical protein